MVNITSNPENVKQMRKISHGYKTGNEDIDIESTPLNSKTTKEDDSPTNNENQDTMKKIQDDRTEDEKEFSPNQAKMKRPQYVTAKNK